MKKVIIAMSSLLCATTFLVVSCTKASEDKLGSQDPTTPTCDTTNSTYLADVVPILQANCYRCHGNGEADGGVQLDTYASVKEKAEDGDLIGTITHASGYPPMPEDGGKLSDCDINTIDSWIRNGMQNN